MTEVDGEMRTAQVRVEGGEPDDAELAALVTALLAVTTPAPPAPSGPRRAVWVRPAQFQAPGSWSRFGSERPMVRPG